MRLDSWGTAEVAEQAAKVADLEAAQVELTAGDGQQQIPLVRVEEVDPAVAALLIADGA